MRKILILSLVLGLGMSIIGCSSVNTSRQAPVNPGPSRMVGPNWLHPGSASEQQRRAIRYDPYPQIDMGPSTTNVRPREYEKPIAEPSQARWYKNGWEP
jgi:hypothetical protein